MNIKGYFDEIKNIDSERLGTEEIRPLLISMATPSIIAMLMQAFYNTVDSMFVAKISSGSLAAVTLVFPVQMIIGAMSTGKGRIPNNHYNKFVLCVTIAWCAALKS